MSNNPDRPTISVPLWKKEEIELLIRDHEQFAAELAKAGANVSADMLRQRAEELGFALIFAGWPGGEGRLQ